MSLDIIEIPFGRDIGMSRTDAPRAANIVSTQLGSLEYAPNFGSDLEYFLQDSIRFQNESFKAYLIQRLSESQVNVVDFLELIETFATQQNFVIGEPIDSQDGGLIA